MPYRNQPILLVVKKFTGASSLGMLLDLIPRQPNQVFFSEVVSSIEFLDENFHTNFSFLPRMRAKRLAHPIICI
jgi:hypothetical protein